MTEHLGLARVKDGAEIQVVAVTPPDAEYEPAVRELLAHKGLGSQNHMRAGFAGETGALVTRFYLGLLDGRPVSNVMIVEWLGIGILGHVFTRPEQRRRGLCSAVMSAAMSDFSARSGRLLTLSTGFESPPYWIYRRFGFRSVRRGFMRFAEEPEDALEAELFDSRPVGIVEVGWEHWPLLAALGSFAGSELLRSVGWKLFRVGMLESPFSTYMYARQHDAGQHAVALELGSGAVGGCATVLPDPAWPETSVVDVFTHLRHDGAAGSLLKALRLPAGRLVAYLDSEAGDKAAAYEAAGFELETALPGHLRHDGCVRDVFVYGRENG